MSFATSDPRGRCSLAPRLKVFGSLTHNGPSSTIDCKPLYIKYSRPCLIAIRLPTSDPTFWPLHGNAERFMQLLRELDYKGNITFDQTWGYVHDSNVPSDDHLVCDWRYWLSHNPSYPRNSHPLCR